VPKKTASKTAPTVLEEADPRFIPVAAAFARTAGFSLMESKSGAMRGLMHDGKSFGMSTHGRFVLKLGDERVAALVAQGIGRPFSAGAGRTMKGWIEITHARADWVALAREAHGLASSPAGKKKAAKKVAKAAKKAGAKKAAGLRAARAPRRG
jgi:hypothetical protein